MEELNKDEVINLFINSIYQSIYFEEEIPRINFIFDENFLNTINSNKIDLLKKVNNDYLSIRISNPNLFFELLTLLLKEESSLESYYGYSFDSKLRATFFLRRIWLKLGTSDIDNIYNFIINQINFIKSREFDDPNQLINFGEFMDYNIIYSVNLNNTYCETSRKVEMALYKNDDVYDLPSVLYDIKDDNVEKTCYILALQNEKDKKTNKKIERKLYKLNSSCENGIAPVHPSFIASILIFIDILKSHNINHIRVPLYQVLSYDYHVLLSNETIRWFNERWSPLQVENLELFRNSKIKRYENLIKQYEYDKKFYNNTVNKEDLISKNKTENLSNLFLYLNDNNILNINYIDEDDTIDISLKSPLLKYKMK